MPLLTAKCSIVSNTMGGADGGGYWATILGIDALTSTVSVTRGTVLSDSSPVFVSRASNTSSGAYFGKLTPSGDLDWSKSLDNGYSTVFGNNTNAQLYVDPSDNFYFTMDFPNTSNDDRAGVFGFDSSGTNIFDYHYGLSGNDMRVGNIIGGASAGYIHVAMGENATDDVGFNAIDLSNGTSDFYEMYNTVNSLLTSSMMIAPTSIGAITMIAYHDTTADKILVSKYSIFSGSAIWTYALSGDGYPSTSVAFGNIAYDSNFNYYLTHSDSTQGSGHLLKFSDSGSSPSIAWAVKLPTSSNGIHSLAVDSSGNVYALQYYAATPNRGYVIYKYNSSGVLQWQRTIIFTVSGTNQTAVPYSIVVDDNDNPVIFGYAPNCHYPSVTTTRGAFIAKLPPDGSGTGTYNFSNNVVMNYSVSSFTVVSSSPTATSISYPSANQVPQRAGGIAVVNTTSILEEKMAVS